MKNELKKLSWSVLALSLGLAASLHAEPRTFTSPDGRTVEAEVESATPDMVTLKLASGQTLATQITKFSDADQAYIAEWRKANPVAIKYAFAANFSKDKRDSSKSSRNGVGVTTESWLCNLKIANRSGQTLENLKVDYEIYYTQNEGAQTATRKVVGSLPIASIKHLEETVLQTKEIKLFTSKLEGGFYYADGSRSRKKDAIDGVTLKITHSGQTVFDWESYGVPKDRAGPSASESLGTLPR